MTVWAWLLVNLVVLFAAFIMSVSGFGFVLVTAALLLFLLDARDVVIINVILGTLVCIPPLWQMRRHFQIRPVGILFLSSILGLPLGIYALSRIPTSTLKIFIIVMVVVFSILLALGVSVKIRKERVGLAVSGFISGALSNSAGMGGPPIVLFLLNQGWSQPVFRANIAAYFMLNGIAAAISLAVSGNLPGETLIFSLTTVPAMAIGYFGGALLMPRINTRRFRKIAIYVLLGCSLLAVINAVVTMV